MKPDAAGLRRHGRPRRPPIPRGAARQGEQRQTSRNTDHRSALNGFRSPRHAQAVNQNAGLFLRHGYAGWRAIVADHERAAAQAAEAEAVDLAETKDAVVYAA